MNNKEAIRNKLNELRLKRSSKFVQKAELHKVLTKVAEKKETPAKEQQQQQKTPEDPFKVNSKTLYKLRKKYPVVTDQMYSEAILYTNKYTPNSKEWNHYRNIIAVYNYNQSHKEQSEHDIELDL